MIKQSLRSSGFVRIRRTGALLLSLIAGVLGVVLVRSVLGAPAVVSAPEGDNVPSNPGSAGANCTVPLPVTVTKTVDPSYPDTGGRITICFTIKRPALDVVLAQDVSNSMNRWAAEGTRQTRLEACQQAARAFIDSLQGTDRAALVAFSRTVVLTRPLTTLKSMIAETIDDLVAAGRTNVGEAIRVSHEELVTSSHCSSDTLKAIVLLSDGNANCNRDGLCDGVLRLQEGEQYALEEAEHAASNSIRIYTVGYGEATDVNTSLLYTIAMTTAGEFYFAPDEDALAATYMTIALPLRGLVITDVLTPGVEVDCFQWPYDLCADCPSGAITVSFPISDSSLISAPLSFCFTANVDLAPGTVGPINDPGSGFCYRSLNGQTDCHNFDNPVITVTGRNTTALVLPIVMNCYSSYCSSGIVNGDFELGWDGWMHGGELSQTVGSADPYSGNYSVRLGDPAYKCSTGVPKGSAWMEQTVLVPCSGEPKLSFSYSITTYDINNSLSNSYDLFEVRINGSQVFRDMPPATWYGCQDPAKVTGWVTKAIDLTDYKGSCITIRFANWNRPDKKYNTWTYVDNVRIDR